MAFQAGLFNIAGFMACHRFVSHVTGFATFFGNEAVESHFGPALGMLAVPAFFLLGAILSGLLVDVRLKLHKKPKYFLSFGLIFFLALALYIGGIFGAFGIFGEPIEAIHDYALLALLCLICGVQNGTITTVSKSVVRTTHLTGITTDLGIGIARFLNRDRLHGPIDDEVKANLMRMGIIFFFGFGSVVGGIVFRKFEYGGFLVPVLTSGILFWAMLYFQVLRRPAAVQKSSDAHAP
ncbi:MAG: YoaK family protein [Bdellovibrionota bacterium]